MKKQMHHSFAPSPETAPRLTEKSHACHWFTTKTERCCHWFETKNFIFATDLRQKRSDVASDLRQNQSDVAHDFKQTEYVQAQDINPHCSAPRDKSQILQTGCKYNWTDLIRYWLICLKIYKSASNPRSSTPARLLFSSKRRSFANPGQAAS